MEIIKKEEVAKIKEDFIKMKEGVIKKVDVEKKNEKIEGGKQLTLSEKQQIAGGAGIVKNDDKKVEEVQIVPPDQDIKNMLNEMQTGSIGSGIGGNIGGGINGESDAALVSETPPLPMDKSFIKGLLHSVYILPSFAFRIGEHELPAYVEANLDMRAEQLHAIFIRYGWMQFKYLDLLIFGIGFSTDMAVCIGEYREVKKMEEKLKEEEKKLGIGKGLEMTQESMDLKEGLAQNN